MSNGTRSTWDLIKTPAVITLLITLIRLIGELLHWSPRFFNASAGGPGAIVGIVWLVPIFGIYFAIKLAQEGAGPESKGKAIGLVIVGIAVAFGGMYIGFSSIKLPLKEYIGYIIMIVSWFVVKAGWNAMGKTLLAYGYAARIPVLIVMFFAIWLNWTTHYNAFAPGELASNTLWAKLWHGAILPQMIFWITFTVLVGALFGVITSFFVKKAAAAPQAA